VVRLRPEPGSVVPDNSWDPAWARSSRHGTVWMGLLSLGGLERRSVATGCSTLTALSARAWTWHLLVETAKTEIILYFF